MRKISSTLPMVNISTNTPTRLLKIASVALLTLILLLAFSANSKATKGAAAHKKAVAMVKKLQQPHYQPSAWSRFWYRFQHSDKTFTEASENLKKKKNIEWVKTKSSTLPKHENFTYQNHQTTHIQSPNETWSLAPELSLPTDYQSAKHFKDGRSVFIKNDNTSIYINKDGNIFRYQPNAKTVEQAHLVWGDRVMTGRGKAVIGASILTLLGGAYGIPAGVNREVLPCKWGKLSDYFTHCNLVENANDNTPPASEQPEPSEPVVPWP